MDALIVRMVAAMVAAAIRGGDPPGTPSGPVEIGTGGTHRSHAEIGSWQMLILMFVSAVVIGTAVLVYVVRQRRRVLERRRLRRMAEAVRPAEHEPHADIEARPDATPASGFRAGPAGSERVT